MGCLAKTPNSNCSWISGDAIFLTRTTKAGKYAANNPASLNNPANWEFYCGKLCWTSNVAKAMPIFSWKGRVGTVTATWHGELQRYLIVVTTPTFMPSTVGPYDTYA